MWLHPRERCKSRALWRASIREVSIAFAWDLALCVACINWQAAPAGWNPRKAKATSPRPILDKQSFTIPIPFWAYGLPVLFIEEPTLFLMDNPPRRYPLFVQFIKP